MEQILGEMDKICSRLERYSTKHSKMGLDTKEIEKYYILLGEYLKLKLRLTDTMFNSHILPKLLNGEANRLYYELGHKLKWKCELLVDEKQMEVVFRSYKIIEDKEKMRRKIESLYTELSNNLDRFLEEFKGEEVLKEISMVLSDGLDSSIDSIKHQLDLKFETLYIVLLNEEVYDEKVKESRRD